MKSKFPGGEKHPRARFTADEVRQYRERYWRGGESIIRLAREKGVSFRSMRMMLNGITWSIVPLEPDMTPSARRAVLAERKRAGCALRPRATPSLWVDVWQDYLGNRCTYKELGRKHGISESGAWRIVRRMERLTRQGRSF